MEMFPSFCFDSMVLVGKSRFSLVLLKEKSYNKRDILGRIGSGQIMYRKTSSGWLKHYDFIILDLLCLQLAFIIAYILRIGLANPYGNKLYCSMAAFLVFADVAVIFFYETFSGVLKRGYYKELSITVKHSFLVAMLSVFYLFATQTGADYSRLVLVLTGILYVVVSYSVRLGWKYFLRTKISEENKKSLLVITLESESTIVVERILNDTFATYVVSGIIVVDSDKVGEKICGIPVVATKETAATYVCHHWVDEVLVHVTPEVFYLQQLLDDITETGVIVHISLTELSQVPGKKQFVETLGAYTVLTTSINCMTQKQAVFKRLLDVIGGLIGCVLTGIVFIFVAPAIFIASPGPIFFSQIRVGKNGKKFKIYKFRSMYMNAEERKKELMKQNRIKDGRMFKLDFDPRIIGNKVLADGTNKTGIGDFIRRTSLDEFPQFYNVLRGEMSLVGTRPPTLDEWEKYELHHRARLATKPGITGMWQVSGRSEITDFEEVVKLDTKYINEWSMGLDLRILFKTVVAVLRRDGSM